MDTELFVCYICAAKTMNFPPDFSRFTSLTSVNVHAGLDMMLNQSNRTETNHMWVLPLNNPRLGQSCGIHNPTSYSMFFHPLRTRLLIVCKTNLIDRRLSHDVRNAIHLIHLVIIWAEDDLVFILIFKMSSSSSPSLCVSCVYYPYLPVTELSNQSFCIIHFCQCSENPELRNNTQPLFWK